MAKRKYTVRTQAQREQETKEALELHHSGLSIRDIAHHVNRPPASVYDDIKRATAKFQEANQEFIQEKLMESFMSLEMAEAEALQGWFESLNDAEKHRLIEKSGSKEEFTQNVTEKIGQSGDPRFLSLIIKSNLAKQKLFETMSIKKSKDSIWDKLFDQIKSRKNTSQEQSE